MDELFEASFSPLAATGRALSKCGKCKRYMRYIPLRYGDSTLFMLFCSKQCSKITVNVVLICLFGCLSFFVNGCLSVCLSVARRVCTARTVTRRMTCRPTALSNSTKVQTHNRQTYILHIH